MTFKNRYTSHKLPQAKVIRWQREFFQAAGPGIQLLKELLEDIPNVSLVFKNAKGRIMHMNAYGLSMAGWRDLKDILGYTSEDLYPPDQAAVYAGRDREVLVSGIPIVKRIYGFVADRSSDLNCVTVRPIRGINGRCIGTATIYRRAQQSMNTANWYDPIRKSIAYLNEHYQENTPVSKLARISNYSEDHFRKLFTQLAQTTPAKYILKVRVNAAKTLLTTTDKLITEIAAEVGFCDHSHFIKAFRRLTGKTPNAYRREISGRI